MKTNMVRVISNYDELEREVEKAFHLDKETIDILGLFGEYCENGTYQVIYFSDEALEDIKDSIDYGRRVGWEEDEIAEYTYRMMVIDYLRHEFPGEVSILWFCCW